MNDELDPVEIEDVVEEEEEELDADGLPISKKFADVDEEEDEEDEY